MVTQIEPDLPNDYAASLTSLKDLVRQAQFKADRT